MDNPNIEKLAKLAYEFLVFDCNFDYEIEFDTDWNLAGENVHKNFKKMVKLLLRVNNKHD